MNSLVGFMLESAVVNTVPIFLAAGVVAFIGGPFLKNAGIAKYPRGILYAVIGVAAGLWSYIAFDIPDRNIEPFEFIALSAGMLIYSLVVVLPIVAIKNRAKT
mgnify:CR=1 FL=1